MASDTWFRFYNTAPDHPKVLCLTDSQFRAWVALICMASKLGGKIPCDIALISRSLRFTQQKTHAIIEHLTVAGLLDRDGFAFVPHNWNEKQFKSDVSTDRVKRFRNAQKERKETAERNGPETETKAETDRNSKAARMARFKEFWLVCPKKTAQGAAEKAWIKALDLADAETLIAAMRAYAATCGGKEKAYIKTPGPWLNEKRWLDEGIAPVGPALSPEATAELMDKRDKLLRQGKYDPQFGGTA